MSKIASSILNEKVVGVNLVESEIEYRKLLFIGRLPSVPNIPITFKELFRTRIDSFYDEKVLVSSLQFLRHCASMIL